MLTPAKSVVDGDKCSATPPLCCCGIWRVLLLLSITLDVLCGRRHCWGLKRVALWSKSMKHILYG